MEIQRCTFRLERGDYLTYYMADLMIFYVIPLILTCLLYTLIARILLTSPRPSGTPGTASASPSTPRSTQSTQTAHHQYSRTAATLAAARIRRTSSSTSSRVQVHVYIVYCCCSKTEWRDIETLSIANIPTAIEKVV